MITIQIEPADNGVLKFLIDDNVNGGGEEYTSRMVYDFEGPTGRANQIKFLRDLVLDLGMSTGSELDRDKMVIQTEWGKQYTPNELELKNISIYSVIGKEVYREINPKSSNGIYQVEFKNSGIYLLKIANESANITKKIIIQ